MNPKRGDRVQHALLCPECWSPGVTGGTAIALCRDCGHEGALASFMWPREPLWTLYVWQERKGMAA